MDELPPSPSSPDIEDTWPLEDSKGQPVVEDASLDEQVTGGAPNAIEYDDDASGTEAEVSQGTTNTVGLMELGSAGQLCFSPDKCLVWLATSVHGHAIWPSQGWLPMPKTLAAPGNSQWSWCC
jgi:hypothetical protein